MAALLLLESVAARAADPNGAEPRARAEALKDEAFALIAAEKYAAAIEKMREAHALVPHPGFALNIAVAYDRWRGHCAESLLALDRFEAECGSCALRDEGAARRREVEERCVAKVRIETEPSGAAVKIDGIDAGPSPLELKMRAGKHEIEVARVGWRGVKARFEIEDAEAKTLSYALLEDDLSTSGSAWTRDEKTWGFIGLGVGLAGILAGTALAVRAVDAGDEADRARLAMQPPQTIEALEDDERDAVIGTSISFALGITAAAAGAILLYIDEDETLALAPRGAGFVLALSL